MWIVLTLAVVGAGLLLLETILPGLISGIIGFCCLVGAVAVGYSTYGAPVGHWILVAVVIGLTIGTGLWIKYFPQSPMARVFISKRVIGELNVDKPELLSQTGIAQTNLRPSGTALINGRRIDVVSEGPLIERGQAIRVIAVEGMRVVVRGVSATEELNPSSAVT